MTQALISHMLGVRRAGVTRRRLKLQHAGIIRYRRGCIHVVDRGRLEAQACEYSVVQRERDPLVRPSMTSA